MRWRRLAAAAGARASRPAPYPPASQQCERRGHPNLPSRLACGGDQPPNRFKMRQSASSRPRQRGMRWRWSAAAAGPRASRPASHPPASRAMRADLVTRIFPPLRYTAVCGGRKWKEVEGGRREEGSVLTLTSARFQRASAGSDARSPGASPPPPRAASSRSSPCPVRSPAEWRKFKMSSIKWVGEISE